MLILSGVLERHPRITLVMGETEISWLPHYIDRMDYMVTDREYNTGLPLLPSEYWYRHLPERETRGHDHSDDWRRQRDVGQ